MKTKFLTFYMDIARRTAELSTARRLKVGAILVKDNSIQSFGYNGTPAGWDNNCEDEIGNVLDNDGNIVETRLKTKPEVIHAERNALDKLTKNNGGAIGASMFITHAPCLECAKSIYNSGISKIYYHEDYRSVDGIEFLNKCGVSTEKV